MKYLYPVLVIFIIFLGCSSPEPVEIPDANLATALREALDLAPNAPITAKNLKKLEFLSAGSRAIKNLTGIEKATGLIHLSLYKNQIVDITPIAGLTKLRKLDFYGNQIVDITPLSELEQLEWLRLHSNQIHDITPLTQLKQLDILGLSFNQISNINPLAELKQLKRLFISNNQIVDITSLTGLTQLTHCTATGNSGHSLRQDCGIISIYLKGVSDGETKTKKLHSRVSGPKLFLRLSAVKVPKQKCVGNPITSAMNNFQSGSDSFLKMRKPPSLNPLINSLMPLRSESPNLSNLLGG